MHVDPHRSPIRRQRGFTLVELMVALVLGALVVLAATAMVVSSRATYRTQDESTRLAESARAGLELGNRLVRLAGYTNFGEAVTTPPAYTVSTTWVGTADAYALDGPNLVGANNSAPDSGTVVNGSDSLTIRYYGTGIPADGNVLDCAGVPVPAPAASFASYSSSRAYNVIYVGLDTDNEPALMCKRQKYDAAGAPDGFDTPQVLIRGVEDFQVLYGEAVPQGSPNDDLDVNAPQSLVYRTGLYGPRPVVNWANVMTVRIAMLLRSGTGTLASPLLTTTEYRLFGDDYAATGDTGARFTLTGQSATDRTRARRVVQTTVFVRNRLNSWPALDQIN